MQAQPIAGPHRSDAKRGKRVRVAPGVFVRAGKYLVGWTDQTGVDRMETIGSTREAHRNGLTLTQAKAERERRRVKAREGAAIIPSRQTFADVWQDFEGMFLSLVAAGERTERTLELYRGYHAKHLEPALGRVLIQRLGPEHVTRLLRDLRDDKALAPWTVKGIWNLLSAILNHAVSRSLIAETPLKRVSKAERPKVKAASRPRVLPHEEIARLLRHTLPTYQAVVATAVFSGMRLSELLGLRWRDIDFDDGFIRVRHQLSRATRKKPARLLPLKTDAGARDVVLLPQLAALLRKHKAGAFAEGRARPEDFVFTTAAGTPLYQRNVSARGLDKAADKAGLNREGDPRVSMHDLRHTFASHLILDLKLDVVTVSGQLGHSRPSVTSDVYAHLFDQARHAEDIRARMEQSAFGRLLEEAR